MILDERTEFCDATALSTAATGIARVGDVVPLSKARDIGQGSNIFLVIQVDTAVDSAADGASVEFQLVSDSSDTIAVDGSATVHAKTGAIPQATLVAGYTLIIPLPWEGPAYESYLAINQNVTGEKVTAGKINAFLTLTPSAWKAYPDAT